MGIKCLVGLYLVGLALGAPQDFWKGTALDATVEKLRNNCDKTVDSIACVQIRAFKFLDTIIRGSHFEHSSDSIVITKNGLENEVGRSNSDTIEDAVTNFIKSNDVTFKLPYFGRMTVDSRNLDDDEINFKLDFTSENEERGKKHKLKKVFIPILTLVLLKAITVVPFIIGILALKAWNGLQLSLFSFIIAVGLAIFQLCQKLASNAHAPVILDHPPAAKRSLDSGSAQELAYSQYVQ